MILRDSHGADLKITLSTKSSSLSSCSQRTGKMKAELPFGLLRSGKDSQEEPELTERAVVSEFQC